MNCDEWQNRSNKGQGAGESLEEEQRKKIAKILGALFGSEEQTDSVCLNYIPNNNDNLVDEEFDKVAGDIGMELFWKGATASGIKNAYNNIVNKKFNSITIRPDNNKALILKIMADANLEKINPDYCYRGIGLGVKKTSNGYKVENVYNNQLSNLVGCVLTHYYDHEKSKDIELSTLSEVDLAKLFHKNDDKIKVKYINGQNQKKEIEIDKTLFIKCGEGFEEIGGLSIESIKGVVKQAKDQIKQRVKSLLSEVEGLQQDSKAVTRSNNQEQQDSLVATEPSKELSKVGVRQLAAYYEGMISIK
jgi:hypothetical protein